LCSTWAARLVSSCSSRQSLQEPECAAGHARGAGRIPSHFVYHSRGLEVATVLLRLVLTYRLLVLVEGLPTARDSAPETGSLSSNVRWCLARPPLAAKFLASFTDCWLTHKAQNHHHPQELETLIRPQEIYSRYRCVLDIRRALTVRDDRELSHIYPAHPIHLSQSRQRPLTRSISKMAGPLQPESSLERPSSRDSPERGKKRASMSTAWPTTSPAV
jgi:hypothetical protein